MSTPDKPNPGIGSKPSDCYTVPLCNKHHREQHRQSERAFWQALNINPILLAADLYRASPHVWAMERIVRNARTA